MSTLEFENTVVKAIKSVDEDVKLLRAKVATLEVLIAEIALKVEQLQPPKPVINRGAWMDQWGCK